MTRGVRLYLVGSFVLVSLAGCGRGFFQSAEREPWRAEAEIACLKSGAVKESLELVRVEPISGPGACGAQYPLKVAALGEGSGSFGFANDLRPPGEYPQSAALAGAAATGRRRRRPIRTAIPATPIPTARLPTAPFASPVTARHHRVRSRCPRPVSRRRMMRSICRPKARPTTGRPRAALLIQVRRPIRRASAIPRLIPNGRTRNSPLSGLRAAIP